MSKQAKSISAITRINKQLKAQGIPFQLVRGRGYYYLMMLEGAPILHTDSIYWNSIEPKDYEAAAREVMHCLASAHSKKIEVKFEGVK